MSRQSPPIRFLILGGILSFLLHLAAGLSLGSWSLRDLTRQPTPPSGRPEASRPPEPLLGLKRSRNVTISWLGFEQATEHSALEATIDQAELTRDPVGAPVELPAAHSPSQPEQPQQDPAPPAVATTAPPSSLIVEATAGAVAAAGDWLIRLPSEVVKLAVLADAPAPQPQEQTSPGSQPVAEAPTELRPPSQTAPQGTPGEAAQKDSVATSIEQTLEVRPGQPAAAEGLEIDTVRPRWRYTTLLTAAPRNPTVQITFGRDGRVKRASFLVKDGKTLDSGYRDVDEPLLNAVYQWTAAGEALEAIPEPNPNEDPATAGGLTVSIRIILRG